MKKKLLWFLLVCMISLSVSVVCSAEGGSGDQSIVIFTDSVGRQVEVPAAINRVAVSGPLAQIVLFALAPDKLVGIATDWTKEAAQYLDDKYYQLPVLGQLYGGKGEMNLEELLRESPQLVIDVGEPKKTVVEDLDKLQNQTGLPFVHVTATINNMADAFRMLGKLLNMEDEAEELAAYCEEILSKTNSILDAVGENGKVNLLYCLGAEGHNVIAKGSYHAEIMDLLSNNLAVVDDPSAKGTGNEVDMEQVLMWNPDVILFDPDSIYETVKEKEEWQHVKAIQDGKYYEVPFGPYNWMGFPPSAQRFLGMIWMAQLLYPDIANYDLYTEIARYYQLFYHSDLTAEQFEALVANSIPTSQQSE